MSRSCPRCGEPVHSVDSDDGGLSITCTACGAVLRLGDEATEVEDASDDQQSLDTDLEQSNESEESPSLDSLELDDILSRDAAPGASDDELTLSPVDDDQLDATTGSIGDADDLPKLHQPEDDQPTIDFTPEPTDPPPIGPEGTNEESLHEEVASLLDEVAGATAGAGGVGAAAKIFTGDENDNNDIETLNAATLDADELELGAPTETIEAASAEIDFVAESADESFAELIEDEELLEGTDVATPDDLETVAEELAAPAEEVDEFVFESVDDEPLLIDPETEAAPPESFSFEPADMSSEQDDGDDEPSFDFDELEQRVDDEEPIIADEAGGIGATVAGAADVGAALGDAAESGIEAMGNTVDELTGVTRDDELTMEPEDPAVAGLPPAGTAVREAEVQRKKPFGLLKSSRNLNVAPAVPRKRNLAVDLMKVAVGAVVGLGIAQLVLWWAFKVDPLGLAHRLPAALAIAVPEELRSSLPPVRAASPPTNAGLADDADDVHDDLAQNDETARDSGFPAAGSDPATTDSTDDDLAMDNDLATDDQLADAEGSGSRTRIDAEGSAAAPDDLVTDGSTATDIPEDDLLADEMPDSTGDVDDLDDMLDDQLPDEAAVAAAPFEGFGLRGAEEVQQYDLAATLSAARTAHQQSEAILDVDSKKANASLFGYYIALAELADNAVFASRPAADPVLENVRGFLQEISGDAKKLRQLRGATASWFKHSAWTKQDAGHGAFLTGMVSNTNRVGELTEVDVRLTKSRQVTLVMKEPAPAVGSQIVALGIVIDDPGSNLLKYEGLNDRVVWTTDLVVPVP